MEKLTILHISDLHFGIDNPRNKKGDDTRRIKQIRGRQRDMLNSLYNTLTSPTIVATGWKPDVVVVSGDIAWTGAEDEYELYKEWFVKPICECLCISEDRIITCPGNHDIIRSEVEDYIRPSKDVNNPDVKPLSSDKIAKRKPHFANYVKKLCNDDVSQLYRLITFPEWPWVHFITLNSAWDCRDNNDEGKLRVGLPLLEEIIEKAELGKDDFVVTVFHHPFDQVRDFYYKSEDGTEERIDRDRNWLHKYEREPYHTGDHCFVSYVKSKSTFILNGHIHIATPPKYIDDTIELICGTVYSNDAFQFHCRLLQLSSDQNTEPLYRNLSRTLGAPDEQWSINAPRRFHVENVAVRRTILAEEKRKKQEYQVQYQKAVQSKDWDELIRLTEILFGNDFDLITDNPIISDLYHENVTISENVSSEKNIDTSYNR